MPGPSGQRGPPGRRPCATSPGTRRNVHVPARGPARSSASPATGRSQQPARPPARSASIACAATNVAQLTCVGVRHRSALLGDRGCGVGLRRAAPMVARGMRATPGAGRGDQIRAGPVHHVVRPTSSIARNGRGPGVAIDVGLVVLGHRVEDTAPTGIRRLAPGGRRRRRGVGPPQRDRPVLKCNNPGDDLFSRKAALSVSSALESLTSVFGMGTGVASPLESPGSYASGR